MDLKQIIVDKAANLGFSAIGVTSAQYDPVGHNRLLGWLRLGYQADMKYLERAARKRFDPRLHLPRAKSVIICAQSYYNDPDGDPHRPYISIYARGENYHIVIKDKLDELCREINSFFPNVKFKTCVDSSAIAEKAFAVKAGLGFIGHNGLLILSRNSGEIKPRGSFYFLGTIITDLTIDPDPPSEGSCGSCRLCIDSCPTNAIVSERVIDASRCISYHTTQNKGLVPSKIASGMGNIVFGCDICQLVCPHNYGSVETGEPRLRGRCSNIDYETATKMTETDFIERFAHSSIDELKYDLFQRNINIAIINKEK